MSVSYIYSYIGVVLNVTVKHNALIACGAREAPRRQSETITSDRKQWSSLQIVLVRVTAAEKHAVPSPNHI